MINVFSRLRPEQYLYPTAADIKNQYVKGLPGSHAEFESMFLCNGFLPNVSKTGFNRIQGIFGRLIEIFIADADLVFGMNPLFV